MGTVLLVLGFFGLAAAISAGFKKGYFTWEPTEPPKLPDVKIDIIPKPPQTHPEPPKTPKEAPLPPKPAERPMPTKSNREKLYDAAYASLGIHRGRDTSVDKSVNCANALTDVMIRAGVPGLPPKGIASTASLYAWLLRSKDFEKMGEPEAGDICIYPTGYGNGSIRGHAFVKGKFQMMSNNSETGLWDNQWDSLEAADRYYTGHGGIPRSTFRWIG